MPDSPRPPGSIDFELTDFTDARHSLNQPPEGLIEAQRLAPDYWVERRRSSLPSDRALTGHTMEWVMRLPSELRPVQLCERFPRVANAIALASTDSAQEQRMLTSLLTDRRGKRRGFPADVHLELERISLSLPDAGTAVPAPSQPSQLALPSPPAKA